jgi:hypothetical protein
MPVQRGFVEDDHVIQTLAAHRANHAFDGSWLPRRARGRKYLLDPHGFHILPKFTAEDPIAVA